MTRTTNEPLPPSPNFCSAPEGGCLPLDGHALDPRRNIRGIGSRIHDPPVTPHRVCNEVTVATLIPLKDGPCPQLDQVQESARLQKITIGERFVVKEESAASVGTRPWTPEGRCLTLTIAFML
ncbi:hypothetical protein AVEN_136964-1 [Araneus ventricosus]|uniref:Uncharacterized protein n=1 Tax=Araneus ventricosus TaxID=182803 RepID=A0A4Y2BJG4_ARAVE|nr:hypothetical protein AVEN_136964-1 [Araneus ventricosus]